MANITSRYEHFCRDIGCNYYNFVVRAESKPFEMLSDIERRQLEVAKLQCKNHCTKSAYQFYKWLKGKRLTDLTSNLD
jgi:hypothetical protein